MCTVKTSSSILITTETTQKLRSHIYGSFAQKFVIDNMKNPTKSLSIVTKIFVAQ